LIGSGTDSQVFVIIYGKGGKATPKTHLNKSFTNKDKFELGKTDVFKFNADNVGEITKVNISHDGKGSLFYFYVASTTASIQCILIISNNIIFNSKEWVLAGSWKIYQLKIISLVKKSSKIYFFKYI
jgi:hypothetical protein